MSLKHLMTKKITTSAQQHWLFKLMGFNFVVEYKRGSDNIVADALSRMNEKASGSMRAITLLVLG